MLGMHVRQLCVKQQPELHLITIFTLDLITLLKLVYVISVASYDQIFKY